jgi:hypothetical protein
LCTREFIITSNELPSFMFIVQLEIAPAAQEGVG